MIKCPNPDCGFENVDGTQFCEGCGEELPQNGVSVVPAATGDMVKCPACDNLNPAENLVCEVCGSDLHPGAAPPVSADLAPMPAPAADIAAPLDAFAASANAAPFPPDTPAPIGAAPVAAAPAPTVPDPAPAPVVAAAPATTPFDASLTPTVGAAPSLGDTSAPAVAAANAAAAPVEPGRVKLTVEQGMSVGKQFVLGDPEMLVGREDTDEEIYPDIDLSDQDEGFVHRRHATLKFENGALTVTHLGGANKTRLNNRPLPDNEASPVNIGDKIAFGKVVMRVGAN